MRIEDINQEDFDEILHHEILWNIKASELLFIPGIYEILAEEYNNKVFEIWENKPYPEKPKKEKVGRVCDVQLSKYQLL